MKEKDKHVVLCDVDGQVSLTAVAESVNGKELAVVVNDGHDCEVFSWKIDVEEPTAESVISQALNKGHDIALRTPEWSALSVLRGRSSERPGHLASGWLTKVCSMAAGLSSR